LPCPRDKFAVISASWNIAKKKSAPPLDRGLTKCYLFPNMENIVTVNPATTTVKPGRVSAKLRISPRVLSDLIVVAIGEASIKTADGKGSRRILSLKDGCILGVAQHLRSHGFPPKRLRECCDLIKARWNELFPEPFHFEVLGPDELKAPMVPSKDCYFLVAATSLEDKFTVNIVPYPQMAIALMNRSGCVSSLVNLSAIIPGFAMMMWFAQ
jgi:hypothetical protein